MNDTPLVYQTVNGLVLIRLNLHSSLVYVWSGRGRRWNRKSRLL